MSEENGDGSVQPYGADLDNETLPTSPKYVQDAFDRVPAIGEGRRWYDLPFRILSWLSSSWRRRILPRRLRVRLSHGLNYLIPFDEHERNKAWSQDDPLRNLRVPADEHVTVSAIWVIELFPPSEFASLKRTIERNSWDTNRRYLLDREGNREMLQRSRSGEGWTWWRLAEIRSPGTGYWFPDGSEEKLPTAFTAIELRAIQIGAGLTAVAGRFHLTDGASASVDAVWHTSQEPQLIRGAGRPRAEDRKWASWRLTQESRRALHDAARGWMARRCPGFFATHNEPQLLMDMLLLDKHDPLTEERLDQDIGATLRALGLDSHDVVRRTSPEVPQMLLSPVQGAVRQTLEPKRTWALWGNRDVVASATPHLSMYGSDEARAIAHAIDDGMRNFLVVLAISDFLAIVEAKYAELRDSARTRHGTFKARGLQRLRESFLTLSLDLTSVARDVDTFWRRGRRDEARFTLDYAPWILSDGEARGHERFTPIDMNDNLRERQREWFKELIAADRDYRDILSTVASLGASVDAFKIGRLALWVAVASLGVTLATLLIANNGEHTIMEGLRAWLRDAPGS